VAVEEVAVEEVAVEEMAVEEVAVEEEMRVAADATSVDEPVAVEDVVVVEEGLAEDVEPVLELASDENEGSAEVMQEAVVTIEEAPASSELAVTGNQGDELARAPTAEKAETVEEAMEELAVVEPPAAEVEVATETMAEAIDQLASEEPVDVSSIAETECPALDCSEEGQETIAELRIESIPLADSPVICTLRAPEEYLPYDLTAVDALRWEIFADGIPRPSRRRPVPLSSDVEDATLAATELVVEAEGTTEELPLIPAPVMDEEPQASVVAIESLVSEEVAVATAPMVVEDASRAGEASPAFPIECLLDEVVWQTTEALRPQGWLASQLQPAAVGENLAAAIRGAEDTSVQWLRSLAHRLPAQPAMVGPAAPVQPVAPAPTAVVLNDASTATSEEVAEGAPPTVCCPMEAMVDATGHAVVTQPSIDCEVREGRNFAALGTDDEPASPEVSVAAIERHDDTAVGQVLPSEVAEASTNEPSKAVVEVASIEELEIDENLSAVLEFVRSLANPFQARIANGGKETDTIAR